MHLGGVGCLGIEIMSDKHVLRRLGEIVGDPQFGIRGYSVRWDVNKGFTVVLDSAHAWTVSATAKSVMKAEYEAILAAKKKAGVSR
jgi:hypothetical protein